MPKGTLGCYTLDALGITEIELMGDATNIELPDGSVITGQATFTMNGQTRTVGELPHLNPYRSQSGFYFGARSADAGSR